MSAQPVSSGAPLVGKSVFARNVRVGDVIMNEWSKELLLVVNVDHGHENDGRYTRHVIELNCVKGANNKREDLKGSYWKGKTWLVKRGDGHTLPANVDAALDQAAS